MESKEKKASKILKEYNQEHIIKWMDSQEKEIKDKIVNQVLGIDLDELEDLYRKVEKGVVKKEYSITPLNAVIKDKVSEKEKSDYIRIGESVLKDSKYAVVTMAGGQGTRLRT